MSKIQLPNMRRCLMDSFEPQHYPRQSLMITLREELAKGCLWLAIFFLPGKGDYGYKSFALLNWVYAGYTSYEDFLEDMEKMHQKRFHPKGGKHE